MRTWKTDVLAITIGFGFGALIVMLILTQITYPARIIEVEISPQEPDNALQFYVDYLKAHNYTVTEMDLKTNDFQTVENINQFLWLLEYSNVTTCYVDYGEIGFFMLKSKRQAKLWIQMDGIYWELRI